jgi:hypothetical protein
MLNKLKMLEEMRNYKYRMWRTETAQPIRDESSAYLPSKPIRDKIDCINTTRAAMYSKRSAVKTSECDSVAKKLKKSGSSSVRDFIKEVKSQHYVSAKNDKRSCLTTTLHKFSVWPSNMPKQIYKIYVFYFF